MKLTVNRQPLRTSAPAETPLLYVLRDEAQCRSVHYGCGAEQCGACTVLIDGQPTFSCTLSVGAVPTGAHIQTVEGLTAPGSDLVPVQQALLDHNATQCGFCLSGIVLAAHALFEQNPAPADEDIREALTPHLCRCGAHPRILRALRELAERNA